MQRTIVVGDIHGCIEEFDELLLKLEFKKGKDRLILAGDLVDRGPDSVGVVRRAQELQAEAVLGNHEEKHIRWRAHEEKKKLDPTYKNPMRKLGLRPAAEHNRLNDQDMQFLRSLPISIRIDPDWLVVHGGIEPCFSLDKQDPKHVIRLRYVNVEGVMMPLEDDYSPPEGAFFWTKWWKGPESVIYGHNVDNLDTPRIENNTYGIDTGCCFGGHLTAMVLPTKEFVQVKAKDTYYTAFSPAKGVAQ